MNSYIFISEILKILKKKRVKLLKTKGLKEFENFKIHKLKEYILKNKNK